MLMLLGGDGVGCAVVLCHADNVEYAGVRVVVVVDIICDAVIVVAAAVIVVVMWADVVDICDSICIVCVIGV